MLFVVRRLPYFLVDALTTHLWVKDTKRVSSLTVFASICGYAQVYPAMLGLQHYQIFITQDNREESPGGFSLSWP